VAGQSRTSDIDVNAPEFLDGLRRAYRQLVIDSEQDLQRFAIDVQNRARELCPVDTGRLRSSIQHKPGRDQQGPFVDVGTNVEYAGYVEFGTRFQKAQPYLRPALAEATAFFARRTRRAS